MTASEPKRNRRKVGDQCKTPEMNSSKREILFGGWLTGFAKKQLSQLWLQFLSFLSFFFWPAYTQCVCLCVAANLIKTNFHLQRVAHQAISQAQSKSKNKKKPRKKVGKNW